MRRVVPVLMLAAAAACSGGSGATGGPDDPEASTATTLAAAPTEPTPTPITAGTTAGNQQPVEQAGAVLPEGFDLVAATVTEPDGNVCDLCVWLAETADQRSRGLMHVTDLGPADGMAFVYPAARTSNFWMKNTLLPLSIAFFGPSGRYLDAFDMEPCEADPCPLYRTAPDFLIAIETVRGGLDRIGVVPGSTIHVSDLPCDP